MVKARNNILLEVVMKEHLRIISNMGREYLSLMMDPTSWENSKEVTI